MTETTTPAKHRVLIIGISLALPVIVTVLHYLPKPSGFSEGTRALLGLLPLLNATVNGTTALVLVVSFLAIRKKNVQLHRKLMMLALVLSGVFLASYVTYHYTMPSTAYGGEGTLKGVYYFILLTHIALSAVIVPLVLISLSRALTERYDRHRKIARWTLPLWLYVAVTGVLVYVMISPYYVH